MYNVIDSIDIDSEDIKLKSILQWLDAHPNCENPSRFHSLIKFKKLTLECLRGARNHPLLKNTALLSDALLHQLEEPSTQPTDPSVW